MSQNAAVVIDGVDHAEKLTALKAKKEEILECFQQDVDKLESDLIFMAKKLASDLRGAYLDPQAKQIDQVVDTVERQVDEVHKLRNMVVQMNKLIVEFRQSSATMFADIIENVAEPEKDIDPADDASAEAVDGVEASDVNENQNVTWLIVGLRSEPQYCNFFLTN